MDFFWDLLKIVLPALIVFATAYYLLKTLLEDRLQAHLLSAKQESQKITLPLRLQACERLALMTERIRIHTLLLRLRTPGMTARDLQLAMMLGIQQEVDHNVSQQVYVSDTLWKIVALSRDQALGFVGKKALELSPDADAQTLVDALLAEAAHVDALIDKAQTAIRKEAEKFF